MDAESTRDPLLHGRMLRRAENLSSNGSHVQHIEENGGPDPLEDRRLRRQSTFGGSIMRKLQEVKLDAARFLSRSRSLHGRSPPNTFSVTTEEANGIKHKKGHARSLSEVNKPRPSGLGHSESAPAAINTLGQHRRVLSGVAEQESSSVVSSPVTQESRGPPPPEIKPDGDVVVPKLLQLGTPMTKVSAKKHKKVVFRLDADLGQIVWESKQHKIIPIENIKEIRTGADARYYREQFQLSQGYEDRWLTIIYIMDNNYKTLHLIVTTRDVFRMWEATLRQLHAIRQELMTGLGNLEMRQTLWEKQYWKGADEERDQKLSFEEITKLCKRLNINSSQEDLYGLFKQADPLNRGYLDFEDFRRFVKLLKGRPEIRRIYNKLKAQNQGVFDFNVFKTFMREKQQSTLSREELRTLFDKYAKPSGSAESTSTEALTMGVDAFTSFLLSPDNAVFSDQHAKVHHDMTRPLSEYFISSSHNTYLVGHQLVGDSTIEGYIRALLHSCRSVEVDIYDGDTEPMIFHGKTFTSKVSLREVCAAIKKYGFVASPYPIVISAEVHCSVPQQDMIAEIMISVFGDSLIREPSEGPPKIEALPSPEDLRGKIMLKTKNLVLAASMETSDSDTSFTDTSASSASASEAEVVVPVMREVPPERRKHVRRQSDLAKVGQAVLQRVRSIGKAPSSPRSPSTPQGRVRPSTATVPVLNSAVTVPLSARLPLENAESPRPKPKMSLALVALLVYTVGVKCRGLNKKEVYAPEHMFSLSETTTNKMMKVGMMDLIKHTRTHLVRIYPKGMRVSSSNYEPHRFWATGAQLVALNWQTFDLGYMINHAMFQRNGRSGYVLKPLALRAPNKDLLMKRTSHIFQATIISAQQLPRPKNALGHEIMSGNAVDPYVEVSLYVPDWPSVTSAVSRSNSVNKGKQRKDSSAAATKAPNGSTSTVEQGPGGTLMAPATPTPSVIPGRTISTKTGAVKNNGFNPVWEEKLSIPFECVGDMMDLVFVRFVVRRQDDKEGDEPLAIYCASLGSLGRGYRHLPLHDSQLSQFLFSTLFVRIQITGV